jgi:hypothetical protein
VENEKRKKRDGVIKGRVLEGEKKVGQNRKSDKCKMKRDELI